MSKSTELNREETAQLKSFLNLLVELSIIEPLKQVHNTSKIHEELMRNHENKHDILSVEIGDEPDYFMEEIKLTQLDNQAANTVYLEAELHCPEYQNQLPNYQDSLEEITVQVTPIEQELETSEEKNIAFQKLQDILVGDEIAEIQNNLKNLNHQIYDSEQLLNLLLPQITELLRRKISQSKAEVVEAIAPIIDNAIHQRVEQDKESMGIALGAAISIAIGEQINLDSEEFATAIAPAMGEAIQKQIELEKDKIVDALYPVIGNTIAKYMGETIQAINEQIENNLSFEGIQRKIRARLQGVSEAELIVKQSISFIPQAIFLIHKASGLVICDIQPSNSQRLESDMIAGMLTAIRSFANDCMANSGNNSELNQIDYGNFKIILEVAGYCYLAIIVKGETPKIFINQMRQSLAKIIRNYGKVIKNFEGDLEKIPIQINTILAALTDYNYLKKKNKKQASPLLILSLSILGLIFIPWGIWQYRSNIIRAVEKKTFLALVSEPELSVYRLDVKADVDKLKLIGRVPNQYLKNKAKQIVASTVPDWKIDNQIIAVEIPASPVLTKAEVERVTAVLNQINDIAIAVNYNDNRVDVEGSVSTIVDTKIINQAFEQIPGIKVVSSTVRVKPLSIPVRFYFEKESSNLIPLDLETKVKQIKIFLNQYPMKNVKIIGYSYLEESTGTAQNLALLRAKSVQQALINQGISPSRLQVIGKTNLPPGIDQTQPLWLMRCVVLELVEREES